MVSTRVKFQAEAKKLLLLDLKAITLNCITYNIYKH